MPQKAVSYDHKNARLEKDTIAFFELQKSDKKLGLAQSKKNIANL